ncbi:MULTISPECIES: glycerol-3-phosphate acyltransferase [Anaerolinea]|uniref:Hypothetical membrane protein n=1 Tax=Anaerolinea thermophila (strain DSM 14523 / JCM 11388 / NBRC 100420 / UNI-1) TaxID=926569 RepID=E8N0C1_ANATU|nr:MULTISPECIES: glycerol-3-phosphate acyltransferase [Anaerolinea]BAJ64670.1 hypothetical membrane protein [Anaerolinea thermophila UNI-1]
MDWIWLILSVLIGYLFGSISFARIIVRRLSPEVDLTQAAMPIQGVDDPMPLKTVSATTAGLMLGEKVGGVIGILDMLKAFIPVLVIRLIFSDQPYFLLTALSSTIGRNWPLYYRFQGGRGISTIYGGLLAIDWLGAVLTSVGGMLLGIAVLRDFALVFPLSLLLIIPWMGVRTGSLWYILYALGVNVLFWIAILPELKEVARIRRKRGWK